MIQSLANLRNHITKLVIRLFIVLLSIHLVSTTTEGLSLDSSLSKRTDPIPEWPTDDNIIHQIQCDPQVLQNLGPEVWPPDIDPRIYADLTSVCSYNSWNSRNMACTCPAPFVSDAVYCHPPPSSNEALYNSPLKIYCQTHCGCSVSSVVYIDPNDDLRRYKTKAQPSESASISNGQQNWRENAQRTRFFTNYRVLGRRKGRRGGGMPGKRRDGLKVSADLSLSDVGSPVLDDTMESTQSLSQSLTVSNAFCRSACTGMTDCGGMNFGCVCLVNYLDATLASEFTFTSGRCTFVRKRKRKRKRKRTLEQLQDIDLELCACNSTYVSAGCCDSADGMVEEHVSLKRGILKLEGQ